MSVLRRPMVVVGVALMVVGLGATIVAIGDSGRTSSAVPAGAGVPPQPRRGVGVDTASPQARIDQLQQRLEQVPDDGTSLAALGSAYVAEAARTGDPSLYPLAEESIDRSLNVQPQRNLDGSIAMSSLAAARHDFVLALEWADKALVINPKNTTALGAKGDAQLELGRYDVAFATFQKMINLRPDLPSYSRISYARELQGDAEGAVEAMEAAESSAGSVPDAAFAAFQLGQLEWNRGNAELAIGHFQRADQLDPEAVRSKAALARAAFFNGDTKGAIEQYLAVIQRQPLPQYIAELADIYTVTDQPKEASRQLDLLDAQRRLFEAAGVSVDADIAVINADNGMDLDASLDSMKKEWKVRKSVFVADALSWLLHENGRDQEALKYSDEANRLGTRNALFFYHRSEIHRALGEDEFAKLEMAQAVAINPNFSIRFADAP